MSPMSQCLLAPWWRGDLIESLLADLVVDECQRRLPDMPRPARSGLAAEDIDALLGLDSIDLLDIATAVSVRFGLHHHGLDPRLLAERRLGAWAEAVIEARRRDDADIAFFTSGSTGRPKRCVHPMAALTREVEHWAGLLDGRRRVLRAVPCHHIYGFLFGLMLPARLDLPVVDVRDGLPAGVLARAEPGDLLVAHPGFFALAADLDGRCAEDVIAVTSTGQCPDFVWAAVAEAGIARMLEVYGSSECAGIGSRWSAHEPFELLPWWVPEPGAAERLLRADAEPCAAADRWAWLDRRRFCVHGRLDGAVQVAGENVFPGRVRDVLLSHPGVADAAVRPFGAGIAVRLKAFVVPSDRGADHAALHQRLVPWLTERLRPAERPRRIDYGAALPRTPAGKPTDW
jgi:4-coumarate--CoA ligase (photoactive yellow protein activation family)